MKPISPLLVDQSSAMDMSMSMKKPKFTNKMA